MRAAKLVDSIFQRQVWQGNPEFAERVRSLAGPDAEAAKDYYRIMMGPWDRLKDLDPFLGAARHPAGAGFYPEDMTRDEFEKWLAAHPGDRKEFTSPVTVIRRRGTDLVAVPYSQEYRELLVQVAAELRAGVETSTSPSLRKFLALRADALLSDDYYASDLAWMDLDSPVEVVIGPYETYEDGLLGDKAAFEAFICVDRPKDSEQLALYKKELPFLESRLPIPDERQNTKRGGESPIRVADEVVTGGDALRGVQTMAFNLPNDERVREAKGSKKVLLENMMRAKYDAVLTPVASRALAADEVANLSFEAYFHHVLFHELSHGLGPGRIAVGGRDNGRPPRAEGALWSDRGGEGGRGRGLLACRPGQQESRSGERGPVPAVDVPRGAVPSGAFRGRRCARARRGDPGELPPGTGRDRGDAQGRFRPVLKNFAGGIKSLAHDLLMLEAEGSYAGAQAMVKKYGAVQPAMAKVLESLRDVPVDVEPMFAFESEAK